VAKVLGIPYHFDVKFRISIHFLNKIKLILLAFPDAWKCVIITGLFYTDAVGWHDKDVTWGEWGLELTTMRSNCDASIMWECREDVSKFCTHLILECIMKNIAVIL